MVAASQTSRTVPATQSAIAEAARHLGAGRLVAFPTETVYGLGADAGNDRAVAGIFEAKARPRFNPLIVHIADRGQAEALAHFDARAQRLAAAFWPGPLTLVLPARDGAPIGRLATAGLDTVALRCPAHGVARALLAAAGRPIAAPSANRSGHTSPTRAAHVAAELGHTVAMILDGGPCAVGLESTIIDLSGEDPALLRPGGVTLEAVERIVGPVITAPDTPGTEAQRIKTQRIKAPGMLARHYAPATPLRLDAVTVAPGEALLAFGSDHPEADGMVLNLSASGDLVEAAANLFAHLHRLDQAGAPRIAVMPVPETGLGRAINDRLRRAATPG